MLHVRSVHVDRADHTRIRVWVLDGAQRIELPLGADGALPDGPRQDWVDRGLQAETDQKPHSVQTDVDLLIRPPVGALTTTYLHNASVQAQQAITIAARQMGGYLATFAAPTVRGVTLKLVGCCIGTARLPGLVLTQNKIGDIAIPQSALNTSTAQTELTAPILRIDPTTE